MKITREELKSVIREVVEEEFVFRMPKAPYWERQQSLKDKIKSNTLRYKKFSPIRLDDFDIYPIVEDLAKQDLAGSILKQYVLKKGNISPKQIDILINKMSESASLKYGESYGPSRQSQERTRRKNLAEIGEDGIRNNREF
jgi:hypothetical protein